MVKPALRRKNEFDSDTKLVNKKGLFHENNTLDVQKLKHWIFDDFKEPK
jgi:hypothetical protein